MGRMQAEDRHRQIVAIVQQRGYVSNEELARTFGVTAQTVRRDLTKLGDEGADLPAPRRRQRCLEHRRTLTTASARNSRPPRSAPLPN